MKSQPRLIARGVLGFALIALLGGCASLPRPIERSDEYAAPISGETALDQAVTSLLAPFPDQSAAHFLEDGLDAFAARLAAAERASRTIDAQYYLFHDDVTGNLYSERLLTAAERGVRVRLLLDDMGAHKRDRHLLILSAHPNVDVRIFNPFANRTFRAFEYLYRFGLVTRRMHNKAMIVDNVVAITGGRNIGDDYFDASPKSNFIDMDVAVFGPAVEAISQQFDVYWNNSLSYSIETLAKELPAGIDLPAAWRELHDYAQSQRDSAYIKRLEQARFFEHLRAQTLPVTIGPAEVLVDQPAKVITPPDDLSTHLGPSLWPYFRDSASELVVLNPYFIPSNAGVEVLADAVRRGARVVVLTNSLAANDVAAVHGHYSKYRKPLVEAGVELYELRADRPEASGSQTALALPAEHMSLHVKTFIFDREKTFIGSMNLDPRSVYQNTELGVIVEDAEMAANIADLALNSLPTIAYRVELNDAGKLYWTGLNYETGTQEVFSREPGASVWLRLFAFISRILPVENQL